MRDASALSRRFAAQLGGVLALFALLVQLTADGLALPRMAEAHFEAELQAAICHADSTDTQTPASDHDSDCALCPLCLVLSAGHVLLGAPSHVLAVPLRSALAVVFATAVRTHAPGLSPHANARGPPSAS